MHKKRNGISMVEVVVVMAVLAILVAIGGPYLYGARMKAILRSETDRMAGVLQFARQQSIGNYNEEEHGVDLNVIAEGTQYKTIPEGKLYSLPQGMTFSATLPTVLFKRYTGYLDVPAPSNPVITLVYGTFTSSISITPQGLIDTTLPERI